MGTKTKLKHPTFGVGRVISLWTDDEGRRVARCCFNNPPGMAPGSQGIKPVADVIVDDTKEHGHG